MKNKILITSIAVAISFLVVSFAIIGIHESRQPMTRTEFLDAEPMKNRFLDWINENRAEKSLRAMDMDKELSDIAYREAVRIANADPEEFEKITNEDVDEVVKSYGYTCVDSDGKPANVNGVAFGSPHTRYPDDMEPFIEHYMNFSTSDPNNYETIFHHNASKIGIGIAMSAEKFYVLQYVCGEKNED